MKKYFFPICAIALAITINGCNKCTYYYAYCETGHTLWQGSEHQTCHGDRAETEKKVAQMDAQQHDKNIHNGVGTASVRSVYK